MKRKLILMLLAMLLVFSLAACSSGDGESQSEEGQTTTEDGNNKSSEEESSSEEETVDVTGMEQLEKMYFTMPEGWEKQEASAGTALYKYGSGATLASVSIGYQEETLYTADVMIQAYEDVITQNIGQWDELAEEQVGDYIWNHYRFKDGTIQDGVYAEIYLYSNGKITLYYEFAATTDVDLTDTVTGVLNSIVLQHEPA